MEYLTEHETSRVYCQTRMYMEKIIFGEAFKNLTIANRSENNFVGPSK